MRRLCCSRCFPNKSKPCSRSSRRRLSRRRVEQRQRQRPVPLDRLLRRQRPLRRLYPLAPPMAAHNDSSSPSTASVTPLRLRHWKADNGFPAINRTLNGKWGILDEVHDEVWDEVHSKFMTPSPLPTKTGKLLGEFPPVT